MNIRISLFWIHYIKNVHYNEIDYFECGLYLEVAYFLCDINFTLYDRVTHLLAGTIHPSIDRFLQSSPLWKYLYFSKTINNLVHMEGHTDLSIKIVM